MLYEVITIKTGVTLSNESGSLPLSFTNKKSELEGASPILANADLSYQYKNENFELNTTLLGNYFSRITSYNVCYTKLLRKTRS